MPSHDHEDLAARVAELEAKVAALTALLDKFVVVDEEAEKVTLNPDFVRCESLTIYHGWFDDNEEYNEQDRISLFVCEKAVKATFRMWDESGELAYDIEACEEFVRAEHYQGGALKLVSRAEEDWSSFDVMHPDGETQAAQLVVDVENEGSGLRVCRMDGSIAASVYAESDGDTIAVWDNEGTYQLVRLANTGDNLGAIDGFRSTDSRWMQLSEVDEGHGGRFCMWTPRHQNAEFFVIVDRDLCSAGLGRDAADVPAIHAEAGNRVRLLKVNNYMGDPATGIGVNAAGKLIVPTD